MEDSHRAEGVAELWHKTKELSSKLSDAKNSKLYVALEQKARQKALSLMKQPHIAELAAPKPQEQQPKRKRHKFLDKRRTIFRVDVNYFDDSFVKKTLPASQVRQRQTLWLILVSQLTRVKYLIHATQRLRLDRKRQQSVLRIAKAWRHYRSQQRSSVEIRARKRWRCAMAAVVFANAIRTCKADRLHAAEVLTNFLQLCKTSTPRKLVHRYHRRIKCAQKLWREYRLSTLARLLWLSRLWVDAEKEILEEMYASKWQASLSLLYHSVKTPGLPPKVEEHVPILEMKRREILVSQRFQMIVRRSTPPEQSILLARTAPVRKKLVAPFQVEDVYTSAQGFINAVADLVKPDVLTAKNKENKTTINAGLVPPRIPETLRFLILRQYLTHKRLRYKRNLVIMAHESREERLKRVLQLNEDDVRVMLKVSVPQVNGLMKELFRQAMLPSTNHKIRPMNLIRRTKISELRNLIRLCIEALQTYYRQQVRMIATPESRASILSRVSFSIQRSHMGSRGRISLAKSSTSPTPTVEEVSDDEGQEGSSVEESPVAFSHESVVSDSEEAESGEGEPPADFGAADPVGIGTVDVSPHVDAGQPGEAWLEHRPASGSTTPPRRTSTGGESLVLPADTRSKPSSQPSAQQVPPGQPPSLLLSAWAVEGDTSDALVEFAAASAASGHSSPAESLQDREKRHDATPTTTRPRRATSARRRRKTPKRGKPKGKKKKSLTRRKGKEERATAVHHRSKTPNNRRNRHKMPAQAREPQPQRLKEGDFARSFRNKMRELELRMGPRPRSAAPPSHTRLTEELRSRQSTKSASPGTRSLTPGSRSFARTLSMRPVSSPGTRRGEAPPSPLRPLRGPGAAQQLHSPLSSADIRVNATKAHSFRLDHLFT